MKKNLKKLISTVAALAIAATSSFSAFAANFSDVADTADYKVAVDNLVALGVVNGYEDGTFKPENEITRAEVSKMIVGTMGPAMMDAAEASKGTATFDDVTADYEWASGYIAQGVSKGYINGVGNNKFDPASNVTFAQVVKMLVCVLGYEEDATVAGGYPNGYINQGSLLGITDGVAANADQAVNRGEVATLINNALNIPVKAVVGYETGFAMDENKNLVTVQVPVTEVKNGKGDSEEYETLLTTYFDAYAVRGRILSVDKEEKTVAYQIEFAYNFDGDVYKNGKTVDSTGDYPKEDALYPAGVNVDSLLCAYTDAIIMENEDGDWELISIAAYGKNEIFTLSSELYKEGSYDGDVMEFYKSATSSKTDEYELAENAAVYVNGTLIAAAKAEDAIEKYVEGSATTEVKLVNTPAAGSKTVDSEVDFIMLSVYASAVVDEVIVDDDEATIYIEYFNPEIINDSEIVIDLEAVAEGEADYSIVDTEGNEIALEELVKNDVITIYADFEDATILDKPVAIDMVVSKNTVDGKIMGEDEDNGEYKVNDTMYGFANGFVSLNVGDDYTLYLDKFDKIVKYEKSASVINYGVINQIWTNTNGDEVIRLLNSNGEVVTYTFNKSDEYATWEANFKEYAAKPFAETYKNVIVTYKLNASGRIHSITSVGNSFDITPLSEFSERNSKIGSAKMSDLTKVIDMSNVAAYGVEDDEETEKVDESLGAWANKSLSGKVSAGSVASFSDGEDYIVAYGGEKYTDGTYPLVIVLVGDAKVATTAAFAVVKSTGSAVNEADGIDYDSITVLEGNEEKVLYCDKDFEVKRGDVIVYEFDSEGLVSEVYVLFSASAAADMATIAGYSNYVTDETVNRAAYESALYLDYKNVDAPTSWEDLTRDENYARVGYGVLAEKLNGSLVISKLAKADNKYSSTDIEEIDLASDVNVYVYDQNKIASERLDTGAVASLRATRLADKYYESGEDYNWTEGGAEFVNTVFFKTVEDEITDIILVIPDED